jgi:hypothetical protein
MGKTTTFDDEEYKQLRLPKKQQPIERRKTDKVDEAELETFKVLKMPRMKRDKYKNRGLEDVVL